MKVVTGIAEMYEEKVDVVRYVNQYEAAGSISLLVKPSTLTVLDCKRLR